MRKISSADDFFYFVFYCVVDFVCEFQAFSDELTFGNVYDGADLFECECFPELRLFVLRVPFPRSSVGFSVLRPEESFHAWCDYDVSSLVVYGRIGYFGTDGDAVVIGSVVYGSVEVLS